MVTVSSYSSVRPRAASNTDEIVLQLRGEFLAEARERLEVIDLVMNEFDASSLDGAEATRKIRMEAHSLKGMAATFGFPVVSEVMHLLEDHMEASPLTDPRDLVLVQKFVNPVDWIIEEGIPLDKTESRRIIEQLPHVAERSSDQMVAEDELKAMLIVHSRTIALKISGEIKKYGFAIMVENNSMDVIPKIVRQKPTIVISSYSMEGLNGVDLARALVSMTDTRHVPVALLTSFEADAPELAGLPNQVPVIQLGAEVETEISKALTALEFRWPVL